MPEFRRPGAAALDDVLITDQLGRRARRPPDPARENDAIHALVRDLGAKPQRVLQLLVAVALDLCRAGSAGVSLRERTDDGELFRWVALAGQLAAYAGATTPNGSPCGVCVAAGTPQLFAGPARHFAYLAELPATIEEVLVAPVHVNGDVRGTIWVQAHDGGRRFDAEDARVMTVLADFTGAALHRLEMEAALRGSEDRLHAVLEQERERAWYASQLAGLSAAANTIHSLSLGDVLSVVTDRAREIVAAHQAMTMLTSSHEGGPSVGTVSLSEKYAAWRGHELHPGTSALELLVRRTNRPMRLTTAELDAHPARASLDAWNGRPPLRGWLAAPLRDRDGANLGLIQLSDKYDGEFTEHDEAILLELAQMASVAVQNAQLHERVQAARVAADTANAAKDEFLAMLAHELRNPLGVILNSVSVLDRHGSHAPESIRVRELIRHHTRHLARLLDDLLDLARITQGKIQLRSDVLDLRAVVDITVQAYHDGFEARGQKVSVSVPEAPVYVYGDRARLQQIIGNLLDNASKYTPTGGAVWLSLEEIVDEALLSVRDNGIGIPSDKLEAIFELFTQLDASIACTGGGLGIGLTLVRRLTEMHGGRVHAHSDGRGSGSEFIVRLRRARAPLAPQAPAPLLPRRAYDILIVEDNAAARETLRFVLELEGHRVEASADGLAGVEAGVRQRPDVAFVDIGLPGLDGYEVARRLRAVRGDGVRLFAITGYGQPEDVRRARHAGFDGHLTKPVEIEDVLRILGSLSEQDA